MINIGVDELMKKTNSIYKLAILASRRAYELSQGSGKLVEIDPNAKITTIALQEILEGRITYKEKKKEKEK